MANDITAFQKYIDELDEVYKLSSLTAVLDSVGSKAAKMTDAGSFKVPMLDMDGLGSYDVNTGYKSGAVKLTYKEIAPTYDRGEKLTVDAEANTDTAGIAFGMLSSEFLRTKVVPEIDAIRFAKYATAAASANKKQETLSTGADTVAAISAAMAKLEDAEVTGNFYLYIKPALLRGIQDMDTTKSREVLEAFADIIKVPASRFATQVTLKTGGEDGFGYAVTGNAINFMIVEKSAVCQVTKHTVPKVITPEANQTADAWAFCYRNRGIADIYGAKTAGVYVSYGAVIS